MGETSHYVIRGGAEGRERLRVLSRVMHAGSMALLDRLGVTHGRSCLDVGCGGGDVTMEMARRVGPAGRAVGVDIDEAKLAIARAEAADRGLPNVEFRLADVRETPAADTFDVVYARFLLTHLSDPAGAVDAFREHVRPGGWLGVEDIDFSGHFTYPESPAFRRYHDLYCTVVRRRGGDPNMGPRLPGLLKTHGFTEVGVAIVQPIACEGDPKLIDALTLEAIAGAVLAEGLATRDEIDATVRDLYAFAADPTTLAGVPRIVQAWGRRPV